MMVMIQKQPGQVEEVVAQKVIIAPPTDSLYRIETGAKINPVQLPPRSKQKAGIALGNRSLGLGNLKDTAGKFSQTIGGGIGTLGAIRFGFSLLTRGGNV